MTPIPELTINLATYKLDSGTEGKIAVFLYTGKSDPKTILDQAVQKYVGNSSYHELIDAHLDNPWMRVIVSDINDMKQEKFDPSIHKLDT